MVPKALRQTGLKMKVFQFRDASQTRGMASLQNATRRSPLFARGLAPSAGLGISAAGSYAR